MKQYITKKGDPDFEKVKAEMEAELDEIDEIIFSITGVRLEDRSAK